MIAEYNSPQDPPPSVGDDPDSGDSETDNRGTLILDATCAPQQISYTKGVNLLNEARENLEAIIDKICYEYNCYKPRMYRQKARQDYLNLAKCKKRTSKKTDTLSKSSCNTLSGICPILISTWNRMTSNSLKNN